MTTIKLKNGSGAPLAGDLVQGEPALDLTNKRLYTEDSGGTVIEVGTNPTSLTTGAITSTGIDVTGTVTADGLTSDGNVSVAGAGNTRTIGFDFYGSSKYNFHVDGATDADKMFVRRGTTNVATFDSSGNVGIGTSSPDTLVQASNTSASTNYISYEIGSSGISSANKGGFAIYELGVLATSITYTRDGSGHTDFNANTLVFNNDANTTEYMRIASSGNVGIGTDSPAAPLSVEGSGDVVANFNGTAVNGGFVRFQNSGASIGDIGAGAQILVGGTAGDFGVNSRSGNLVFGTNTAERMRIDASGNVGIGVVPNATGGGYKALQLGLMTNWAFPTSGAAYRSHNLYYDGSTRKYVTTGAANEYEQSSGGHIFSTAASGTAGTNVTLSEAMRIDSDGNLLVGRQTASGLGKLNVEGGADITNGDVYLCRDSGNLLVGTTSAFHSGISSKCVLQSSNDVLGIVTDAGSKQAVRFTNGTTAVGSINVTTSSTSYNTSSDYRLKENVVPLTGATERVKQLNPSRFNFIADADTTVDGFLAHEVADVVPEAITGTKDGMRDEEYEVTPAVYEDVVIPAVLDEEGNEVEAERTEQQLVSEAVMGTRSVPDYQGIDQSKLVPLLVATIQELEARITALESN